MKICLCTTISSGIIIEDSKATSARLRNGRLAYSLCTSGVFIHFSSWILPQSLTMHHFNIIKRLRISNNNFQLTNHPLPVIYHHQWSDIETVKKSIVLSGSGKTDLIFHGVYGIPIRPPSTDFKSTDPEFTVSGESVPKVFRDFRGVVLTSFVHLLLNYQNQITLFERVVFFLIEKANV